MERATQQLTDACFSYLRCHCMLAYYFVIIRPTTTDASRRSHQPARKFKPCLAIWRFTALADTRTLPITAESPLHAQNDADERDGSSLEGSVPFARTSRGSARSTSKAPGSLITPKFASGEAASGARQHTKNWPLPPQLFIPTRRTIEATVIVGDMRPLISFPAGRVLPALDSVPLAARCCGYLDVETAALADVESHGATASDKLLLWRS